MVFFFPSLNVIIEKLAKESGFLDTYFASTLGHS